MKGRAGCCMRHPFIAGMLMAEETGITAKIVGLFLDF
jgi:hypothetical protein